MAGEVWTGKASFVSGCQRVGGCGGGLRVGGEYGIHFDVGTWPTVGGTTAEGGLTRPHSEQRRVPSGLAGVPVSWYPHTHLPSRRKRRFFCSLRAYSAGKKPHNNKGSQSGTTREYWLCHPTVGTEARYHEESKPPHLGMGLYERSVGETPKPGYVGNSKGLVLAITKLSESNNSLSGSSGIFRHWYSMPMPPCVPAARTRVSTLHLIPPMTVQRVLKAYWELNQTCALPIHAAIKSVAKASDMMERIASRCDESQSRIKKIIMRIMAATTTGNPLIQPVEAACWERRAHTAKQATQANHETTETVINTCLMIRMTKVYTPNLA